MPRLVLAFALLARLDAQTAANLLLIVNDSSSLSRTVGEYYARQRSVPVRNVCRIRVDPKEVIARADYNKLVAAPIARCLVSRRLQESVLYLVTTAGTPLRIDGSDGPGGDTASVDSELTLLYADIRGEKHRIAGVIPNPFFGQTERRFEHPTFPIYLVTRLAGYDFPDIKRIIDRALRAVNRGKFVIDLKESDDTGGNDWLRAAAERLPKDRVVLDRSKIVLTNQTDVIGYASWGSNDPNRKQRVLGFGWLPGAIMTEYVSTNARTFTRPPENWNVSTWKSSKNLWFFDSPQTMTADYIHEGATGASGHVWEPYLDLTPRPNYLLPAYYSGRNLAESYYLAIPGLSWQNVVIGDPLCSIGKPK